MKSITKLLLTLTISMFATIKCSTPPAKQENESYEQYIAQIKTQNTAGYHMVVFFQTATDESRLKIASCPQLSALRDRLFALSSQTAPQTQTASK